MIEWKPKELIIGALVIMLAIIIVGDMLLTRETETEHFKMINEIIGGLASGVLLIISNYINGNKKNKE